jgi:hypothetical protein
MVAAIYARKGTEQNSVGDEEKSVARLPMCIQTTASRVPSSRSVQDSSGC